jgi:hypothetical protein
VGTTFCPVEPAEPQRKRKRVREHKQTEEEAEKEDQRKWRCERKKGRGCELAPPWAEADAT